MEQRFIISLLLFLYIFVGNNNNKNYNQCLIIYYRQRFKIFSPKKALNHNITATPLHSWGDMLHLVLFFKLSDKFDASIRTNDGEVGYIRPYHTLSLVNRPMGIFLGSTQPFSSCVAHISETYELDRKARSSGSSNKR